MDMSFLHGKKVLVTGGAGLLGMALTAECIKAGVDVESSYYSRTPPPELAAYFKPYDFNRFDDCLAATSGKDVVIICAVQAAGVQGIQQSPTSTLLPNLTIHAGLFEACAVNGVDRAVWVSSSTVYQEAFHPIRENQLDLNLPVYDLYTGIGGVYRYLEQLASCYYRKRGLKIGVIRTSNIYGPYDRFDDQKSHVIPALIKRALAGETPFTVWGNGYTVRDFIYVDDLVEGVLRVLQSYCNADPINISNGMPVTIRDLVDTVLEVCDRHMPVRFDAEKPTAVPYRVLDNSKCHALLGKFVRTPLTAGLRATVDWYRSAQSRE
ncbi:MAG: NAD-dependent epimerase/dehydratase family protein [Desulfuromonadales bacterium]